MSTDFDFLDEAKPVTQETLNATLQEVADLEAQLKALKKKKGIKVIPVEFDEVMKGFGAIHCCTAFLKRG